MKAYEPLLAELERWRLTGKTATLWWRDDDARRETPALHRLLALSTSCDVPLALATIPLGMDQSLVDAVRTLPSIAILQHGYSHFNHAPPDEKKQELGPHRPLDRICSELRQGFRVLGAKFGSRFQPVLVPPWNRVAPELLPLLRRIGFRGFSVYGPRALQSVESGIRTVNAHVDLIDWRGSRGFLGTENVVHQFVAHLSARRTCGVEQQEPTGLMTHHLDHDDACWKFLEATLPLLTEHDAVYWLSAEEVFRSGSEE